LFHLAVFRKTEQSQNTSNVLSVHQSATTCFAQSMSGWKERIIEEGDAQQLHQLITSIKDTDDAREVLSYVKSGSLINIAIESGQYHLVGVLVQVHLRCAVPLELKHKSSSVGNKGGTPLHVAIKSGALFFDLVGFLTGTCGNPGCFGLVEYFLQCGAYVNSKDYSRRTPLQLIVQSLCTANTTFLANDSFVNARLSLIRKLGMELNC
jgi:hypothetical protein